MKRTIILCLLSLMVTACSQQSRRSEIEQRKTALKHKQDSTLLATQQELALVDSALQQATARHDQLQQELRSGKYHGESLRHLGNDITKARLHRDSLQVQFEVLCAKIKYIRKKAVRPDPSQSK